MATALPLVTLTTDFGLSDQYVAEAKAAVLRHCPGAVLVDVSHLVPPQDVLAGAFLLERAVNAFGAGSIHLAVVDPGVGTDRRLLAVQVAGRIVLCPDNGLITWAWRRLGPGAAARIVWRPEQLSNTFHGRDVLAPLAGRLAAGEELAALTHAIHDPVLLPVAPAARLQEARIIYIDHYGNAVTNVGPELIGPGARVFAGGKDLGILLGTYAEVDRGKPLALINSSGLLEIAVRDDSAAKMLGLKVGHEVALQ